jgi:peptidoglycan/LPS O-acetylase OafA/YrhL
MIQTKDTMAAQEKSTLGPLTSFRFVAAMCVVMHHFFSGIESGVSNNSRLHLLSLYGNLGVPFFFMLSGYILTHSYASTPEKAACLNRKQFWWKRFARVYPLYILSLLIDIPRAVVHSSALHGAAGATIRLIPTFAASVFMLQSWHPYLLGEWNRPSWSLSAEAFFYFLFPVLSLRLAWPNESAWTRAVLRSSGLLVLGCLVIGLAGYASVRYPRAGSYLEFNPALLVTLFVMGIVLYRMEQLIRRQGPDVSDVLNVVCFMFVLAGAADFILNYPLSPGIREAASCLFFLGLIVLGRGGPSWFVRPLSWRFLGLLGEASYAIYLLQFPLVYYFQKVWNLLGLERLDAPGSKEHFYILYTLALIGTSVVVFNIMETPARKYLQRCQPWTLKLLREPVKVFAASRQDRERSRECLGDSNVQSSQPLPSGPEY